jgi:hypothetical protein
MQAVERPSLHAADEQRGVRAVIVRTPSRNDASPIGAWPARLERRHERRQRRGVFVDDQGQHVSIGISCAIIGAIQTPTVRVRRAPFPHDRSGQRLKRLARHGSHAPLRDRLTRLS